MINKSINNFHFWFLLVLFLLLQTTFIPQLFQSVAVINLVLILLIAASLLYKSLSIFYISFFCGLVLNIFSGAYFGAIIISILFAVFISSYLSYYFLKEIFSFRLFLIASVGVAVYNIIYFILFYLNDYYQIFINLKQLGFVVLFNIIFTALIIYPLIFLISYGKKNEG